METFFSSFDNKITSSHHLLSTYYVFCAGQDMERVWTGREFLSAEVVRAVYLNNQRALPSGKKDRDLVLPGQSFWDLSLQPVGAVSHHNQ